MSIIIKDDLSYFTNKIFSTYYIYIPLFNQEKDSLRLKSIFQECPGQDRQPSLHIQINNIVTTNITKQHITS